MDVILIQPRHRLRHGHGGRGSLPLGLLTVATPLDLAGYEVRIIDQRLEPDWESTLLTDLKTKPICVGITAMTGPQIWWGLKASELVKQNSDVPVVWGGVHASLLPRQTLENPYVDMVVQGEGEETLLELVRTLASREPLNNVKGLWYKDGNQIQQNPPRPFVDLDSQPPLSYHLIDLQPRIMQGRDAPLFETSRGCPLNCAFCYNNSFNGSRWRARSVEQTLAHLTRAVEEFGIKRIGFSDDNLFANPDRVYKILEGIVRYELDITWGKGDLHLDVLSNLSDDYLRLIKRSGCDRLSVGIESGSQRIVDMLNKGIDISQAITVNHRLAKFNFGIRYLFMLGTPDETPSDLAQTANLILRLLDDNPESAVGIQIFVPYPGTELYNICVQNGLHQPDRLADWIPYSWSNRHLDFPWWSRDSKSILRMISFCSYFLETRRSQIYADINPFLSIVRRLYRPIAWGRIRGVSHSFMPELRVAEFLGFKGY
ncbi:B12-binding domain-containing radical SAM protein [Chloroflexota bacterium]